MYKIRSEPMTRKIFFSLCILFVLTHRGFATKIISTNDSDWDNGLSWSTNEIPGNPDTIIIRHYITMSRNITINAPTVLIIESTGVLCGDYLLDVSCGATVINYGYLYLNTAKIRAGYNYNEFYAKSLVEILGCTPNAAGFFNVTPNGHTLVWPPVLCRTNETHWTKGTTNIANNGAPDEFLLSISPNPLNSGYLTVSAKGNFDMSLYDTRGSLLFSGSGTDHSFIDMHSFSNGFYFVSIKYKEKIVIRKVLVDQ